MKLASTFCGIAIVLGLLAPQAHSAPPKQPNVVLLLSDDWGWIDYGFMGNQQIKTPNLDRLASDGVLFSRGYVPDSLCRPSLMSILSGLYPHQHKITGNDPADKSKHRSIMLKHVRNLPTLPKLLTSAGYVTYQTGKWWEGNFHEGGFTHGMSEGESVPNARHGDEGLKIGRQGLQPVYDFIEQAGDKPFFVWYAPMLPHSPHTPPERLLKKYTAPDRPEAVAKYYACCDWCDETCGELLGYLDKKGLTDNTIIVYLCDNGWLQDPTKDAFAPRSKLSPYDAGLRTPIIVKWPGHIKPLKCDQPVSSIDVLPTLLAACKIPAPTGLPGVNLLDVCGDKPVDREALFGATFVHSVPDIDDPTVGLVSRWCLEQGKLKLIWPVDTLPKLGKNDATASPPTKPELYDVLADPTESKNLAAERPDDVKRLQKRIDAWWHVDKQPVPSP